MASMHQRRLVSTVVLALISVLVATTAQANAATNDCTYSFANNEPGDIKLKIVVDGKEVTQVLLASGESGELVVDSSETVVVRRPSDRERLYRASGCEGSGSLIEIGGPAELVIPDGVVGNVPVSSMATSCWAADRQLEDGSTISDVTILNAANARVVYARTETSFLGSIDAIGADYDSRIALIKVRGGERKGSYDCGRGWTGDVVIERPNEADGIGRVDVEVLTATPATNGGTNVFWRYGVSGPAVGLGGSFFYRYYLTNTASGEVVSVGLSGEDDAEPVLLDCANRNLAVTLSFFGEKYVAIVDLATGERTFVLDTFVDNAADFNENFGFDCNGSFWFEGNEGVGALAVSS